LAAAAIVVAASVIPAQEPDAPPPARPRPRPERTADEYQKLAAELRTAYAKPPAEWPKPTLDPGVKHAELGLLPAVPYPADNPFSEAKANLGKTLFFDPRLSGSAQIACASCHDPDLGWADGRTVSFGHGRKVLKRNAPSLLNVGLQTALFWDGRATSLEDQAVAVLHNPDEMRAADAEIVTRLRGSRGYRDLFRAAFGSDEITIEKIAKSIATFERGIKGGRSKFDAFLQGRTDRLSDAEVRGLHLFRTDARCLNCHSGPNFTDDQLHEVGLSYYGRQYEDLGRHNITRDPNDVGRFKTPSLRNVGRTAPYMHNGLFDLTGVLNMYNAGNPTPRPTAAQKGDPKFPQKSPLLKPLHLNKHDLQDLEAFLQALTEPRLRVRPPELPPLSDTDAPTKGANE
jgi:cytochrome c peroxidase